MGRAGGWPGIKDAPKPGPTTELGRMRASLNPIKTINPLGTYGHPPNAIVQMLDEGKIPLDPRSKKFLEKLGKSNIALYNQFVFWMKGQTTRSLKEIIELENLFTIFQNRLFADQVKKAATGAPLTKADMQMLTAFSEVLDRLHTLKHGKKNVNVNVGYKDVRDMMFQGQNADPGNQ